MPFAARVIAVLLFAAGAWLFHKGIALRAESEPPQLVTGPAASLFTELPKGTDHGSEIRARSITVPAPRLRRVGGSWRHAGTGAMAASLLLALLGQGLRRRTDLLRLAWCLPGLWGLWRLMRSAGAHAVNADAARDVYSGALPLVGLSLVLMIAWRGVRR